MRCDMCQTEWSGKALLEDEGFSHFALTPGDRKIIESDGKVWVVTFTFQRGLEGVKRCRKCPPMLTQALVSNS